MDVEPIIIDGSSQVTPELVAKIAERRGTILAHDAPFYFQPKECGCLLGLLILEACGGDKDLANRAGPAPTLTSRGFAMARISGLSDGFEDGHGTCYGEYADAPDAEYARGHAEGAAVRAAFPGTPDMVDLASPYGDDFDL